MPVDLRNPTDFARAYREHSSTMLKAADRVLRDRQAAEDVVQDVFAYLWRKPDRFDAGRGSLGSYLTMMARSRAVDRWRTRSARDAAIERSGLQERLERPVHEDAAEPAIRQEGQRRILGALDGLPGDQREAVLLAFGKGLTAREIAKVVGVPLGTAKSRVRLGLQKARLELAAA